MSILFSLVFQHQRYELYFPTLVSSLLLIAEVFVVLVKNGKLKTGEVLVVFDASKASRVSSEFVNELI